MTQKDALQKAKSLREALEKKGYPVKNVYLFGSMAKDTAVQGSDIDVAIVCEPFKSNRIDENAEFLWTSKDIDIKIETVCLHPEDMKNKYSTLVQEVKNWGIPV